MKYLCEKMCMFQFCEKLCCGIRKSFFFYLNVSIYICSAILIILSNKNIFGINDCVYYAKQKKGFVYYPRARHLDTPPPPPPPRVKPPPLPEKSALTTTGEASLDISPTCKNCLKNRPRFSMKPNLKPNTDDKTYK